MHAVLSPSSHSTISNAVLNKYYTENVQMSREDTKKSVSIVMPIVNDILEKIHAKDKRFSAQPSCSGSYYQGLKVDRADEFDINMPILDIDPMYGWGPYMDFYFEIKDGSIVRTGTPQPPHRLSTALYLHYVLSI